MNQLRTATFQSALASAEITADGVSQSFCFKDDFVGFAGHFPGYPILPAILQMLLAQLVAEQSVGESLQFVSLERAKFTRRLRPQDNIRVVVDCLRKNGVYRGKAVLTVADEPAAQFTLMLKPGDQ